MSAKAARRYANAMLETAIELDILEEVRTDMELIHNTVSQSRDLVLFLKSPVIKIDRKRKALEAIFKDRVRPESFQLVSLLVNKKREQILGAISQSFLDLYNSHKGIINVRVYSAFEVDNNTKKELIAAIGKSTGKQVQLDISIDKSLRGGLAVRIGDTVIDDTVKHKIRQLKNKFTANAV